MRPSTVRRRLFSIATTVAAAAALIAGCGPTGGSFGSDADAGGGGDAGPGVDATADADGVDTDGGWTGISEKSVGERGRFNVGYRELEFKYQATADGENGDKMEKREIQISIWYPTNAEDGLYPRYDDKFPQEEVIWKAEPAPLGERPLLIFSHGNGGIAEQSFFMTEYWASRGWIVASPDHTGNTFNSGTAIEIEAAVYRPQDIRAVLDQMTNLESSHPLAGMISDKIAMSGHSFGGYTTLANSGAEFAVETLRNKCENGNNDLDRDYCDTFNTKKRRELFRKGFHDERIDVAIPQAPAGDLIFGDGLQNLQVPTMLMTGGMDQTLPNSEEGDPIWGHMKGKEHRRINLPKAGHFTFSNMCSLFGDSIDRLNDDGCGKENIDAKRGFEIINAYSLAFARYHLFDDSAAKEIIDGERHPVGQKGFELKVGAD